MIFEPTPSQTVGPYFSIGLPWPEGPHAVPPSTPGAITIAGTSTTAPASPIPDHLLEFWQPDPDGRFADLFGHGGALGAGGLSRLCAAAAPSSATAPTS